MIFKRSADIVPTNIDQLTLDNLEPGPPAWANYLRGVVRLSYHRSLQYHHQQHPEYNHQHHHHHPKYHHHESCQFQVHHFHAKSSLCGFEAAIVGSVPLGGGVSSSASVEVVMMFVLVMVWGLKTM